MPGFDFDTLRYLNPGAEPVEVFAWADALIRPDFTDRGLLDTAVVTIRFDNGALATAEASFQAVYGYDVRGEVLGSAGMLTMGDLRRTHLTTIGPDGIAAECVTYDQDLFRDAYVAELADFADSVRTARTPSVTGGGRPCGPDDRARGHTVGGEGRSPYASRRSRVTPTRTSRDRPTPSTTERPN
ncbi:Gfo/Idh/MocA family protein [Streptomyces sp. NPDC003753]